MSKKVVVIKLKIVENFLAKALNRCQKKLRVQTFVRLKVYFVVVDEWMDGWMDGCISSFKGCLQQSKNFFWLPELLFTFSQK
jgi:hypothetical protein